MEGREGEREREKGGYEADDIYNNASLLTPHSGPTLTLILTVTLTLFLRPHKSIRPSIHPYYRVWIWE